MRAQIQLEYKQTILIRALIVCARRPPDGRRASELRQIFLKMIPVPQFGLSVTVWVGGISGK